MWLLPDPKRPFKKELSPAASTVWPIDCCIDGVKNLPTQILEVPLLDLYTVLSSGGEDAES
jgi:hypothetical protein